MNLEAVELGGTIVAGDHCFDVVHRSGRLRDVDNAREDRGGVKGGWRPVARRPVGAPAVHGLDGGAAPHLTLEQRVLGKHQDPLRDRGRVGVERNADVARWSVTRHGWDREEVIMGEMEGLQGQAQVGLLFWILELHSATPF